MGSKACPLKVGSHSGAVASGGLLLSFEEEVLEILCLLVRIGS